MFGPRSKLVTYHSIGVMDDHLPAMMALYYHYYTLHTQTEIPHTYTHGCMYMHTHTHVRMHAHTGRGTNNTDALSTRGPRDF